VRLSVQVIFRRTEAVPATCVPVGQGAGVDFANASSLASHDASNFVNF
jgi:hypothetical protein